VNFGMCESNRHKLRARSIRLLQCQLRGYYDYVIEWYPRAPRGFITEETPRRASPLPTPFPPPTAFRRLTTPSFVLLDAPVFPILPWVRSILFLRGFKLADIPTA
jgi:hypothetical protein